MEENANKLQRLYDDLWRTKETEKTEIIKEKEDALLQIQELKTEIKCLISQKERYEKELSKTEDYLQATNTELAHERAEHEKAKDVVAKSKEFINNAKLIKDEETLRAEEAIARLATFEVQFLQNQSTLKSEQEQRILLQTQLIAFQQQLTERIDSKEKIIKELETRMSESIAEIANLEKKLKNLQKKYSDVQSQMEDERKKHIILDGEYKRLATSNYEAKNQIEKYKAEISSHQKTVAEKNTELQKLCDESNVVLQKLKDFCKK
uniref:Uncharacterized protein n=1 Tax=Panagrolaimus superbus TaxID=310955 RepID=A0A914Z9C7_9BILA